MYIMCHYNYSDTHTLKNFQSLWDGEKFNVRDEHGRCLLRLLSHFKDNQIDYIFQRFEALLLEDLDVIFNCEIEYYHDTAIILSVEITNKLWEKGLQIKGLKEYLQNNIVQIVADDISNYGTCDWIVKLLQQVKIHISCEKFKYINPVSVIIALLDSSYKFIEKVKILKGNIGCYMNQLERENQVKNGLALITVKELQHRYQKRKIDEVKNFMICRLGIIKDLATLILLYI
jgi:hypothetical protein